MGKYLIERHGEKFEITAPSPEAALSALDTLVNDYGRAEEPTPGQQAIEYFQQNGIPGQGHLVFAAKGVESLPVVGTPIKEGIEGLQGWIAEQLGIGNRDDVEAFTDMAVKGSPVEAAAGEVFGNVAPLAMAGIPALGGKLLGMTGNLGSRAGFGALSGSTIAGLDAATDGKSGADIVTAALLGGSLGGALPLAGKGLQMATAGLRQAATPAATEGASEGIKKVSSALFKASEDSTATVPAAQFDDWLTGLTAELRSKRMRGGLDEAAEAAFTELKAYGDEVMAAGQATVGDLHVLRQIVQKAAQSPKGRDSMFGTMMVKAIDGLIASTGDDALKGGISTWARGKRAELIEDAIERARNAASGFENGLKVELRKILNSDDLSQGFNPEELDLMRSIVRGTFTGNALSAIGKLGLGGNKIAGPTIAALIGGAPAMLGATGVRRISEQASENAAQRLLDTVAGGTTELRGVDAVVKAIMDARAAPMRVGWEQAAVPMLAN